MVELLRLFTQIAMLRKGPQDLPASPLLLVLTIAGYFIAHLIVGEVLPPFPGPWVTHLILDVVFTFVWYALLLYVAKKPERFLQTTIAVYGYQTVLSPLLVAALWLQRRFDPESVWQFPVTLVSLALLIWIIAANSHIVKAALEWSMAPSVALVILQTLAGDLLVLTLFPSSTP
ncbi:MAG: hypothetical protein QOI59_3253 [Gammaproteobacteria bacterium]|jgi:hypothetical protein|nr:hypothetical protein [Gammaproteobacteria bacterium]HWM67268.1 hypothetical protein [Steroidobacteraceae bacterium]